MHYATSFNRQPSLGRAKYLDISEQLQEFKYLELLITADLLQDVLHTQVLTHTNKQIMVNNIN